MSNSLQPDRLQNARLSCHSLSPKVCSDSCPLSQWCHPTISFSVTLFSSFPSIKVFSNESALPTRLPKHWSFCISPSNEYSGLISLGLTGLSSLLSKGLSRVFSNTTVQKHQFFSTQLSIPFNDAIAFQSSVFDSVCNIKANTNTALKPMWSKKWGWMSNLALRFEG